MLKLDFGTWWGKPRSVSIKLPGKRGLTAFQLHEWMAYAAIEPFGEYRSELRHGQQMHLLDAANFKRDSPLRPIDFMNFIDPVEEPAPEESPEVLSARIAAELFRVA